MANKPMNNDKQMNRAREEGAFTLVELLVVIAIMGIVAAMVLGMAGLAGAGERRKKVSTMRDQLVTAIESYKKEHGFYPPDNTNNCKLPPLYYELRGGTYDGAAKVFTGSFPPIPQANYLDIFGRNSIANSKPKDLDPENGDVKAMDHIVGLRSQQSTNLTIIPPNEDAIFFTVGVEAAVGTDFKTNTWRYVSTNPTNNGIGHFDLWAEVTIKGKTEIIGNWNQ